MEKGFGLRIENLIDGLFLRFVSIRVQFVVGLFLRVREVIESF